MVVAATSGELPFASRRSMTWSIPPKAPSYRARAPGSAAAMAGGVTGHLVGGTAVRWSRSTSTTRTPHGAVAVAEGEIAVARAVQDQLDACERGAPDGAGSRRWSV